MSTEYFNDQWRIPNNKNQSLVSNYSMDFDGTNDNITLDNTNDFLNVDYLTISIWFKPDVAEFAALIGNRYFNNGFMSWAVQTVSDGRVRYIQKTPAVGNNFYTTDTYNVGEWNHVAVTYSSGVAKIYLNGGTPITKATSLQPIQYDTGFISNNVTIGSAAAGGSTSSPTGPTQHFDGLIDQVSIFDYALPATGTNSVATLYGGGTAVTNPMSLSPKPIAYYQLGDQSVDNGANYLVPNNSLQQTSGYSPYALTLDSNNANHFTLNNGSGNGLLNAATSFTISAWINPNQPPSFGNIFTHFIGGVMLRFNSSGTIQLYVTKEDGSFPGTTATSALTFSNNWQHVVATYDGSFLRIYVDNVLVNTPFAFSDTLKNDTSSAPDIIGNRNNTTQYFDGEISNVAVWKNSVIDVNTLYNEGVPADLTSLNPSGWWQMGSNSSFDASTSKWTCLNEGTTRTSAVPSNATTFAGNMTNDDITNGVGYSANGLGTSSIDIKGDAPYSSANGLSENMDVLDRTTDVPS